MKKTGVLFVILLMLSLMSIISAADNSSINDSTVSDGENFDLGFVCLEEALKEDCSGASTVEELSLSILASPANVGKACLDQLLNKQKLGECWGKDKCTIKDTAMAVLAMDHAGVEDSIISKSIDWLLSKNQTSTDLIWYLQQDSNLKSECKFTYEGNPDGSTITAYDNKKLSGSAGPCLSLASGSFWLQISPNCYEREFTVECDKDFLATLLYQQKNSNVLYILDGTDNAPAFDSISLTPKSACFGEKSCDYEGTAWATIALLKTGHPVEEYIPYIVALEDTNGKYLPKAFSYILTEEAEYANQLIEQKGELNDYWLAQPSAYDKYYDTALAYLAIEGFDSEIDKDVLGWFGFSQDTKGCWKDSSTSLIRDTAITLWAIEGRKFVGGSGGVSTGGTTRCTTAGFYCVNNNSCDSGNVLDNYFCGISTDIVCCSEGLSCTDDLKGVICDVGYRCEGDTEDSVDGSCCLGICVEQDFEDDCTIADGFCRSSCTGSQKEINEDCEDSSLICCKTEIEKSSLWWVWVLILLIILVLGAIGWIYREKLKLWWFKLRSKFRKDKGSNENGKPSTPTGGIPPRPGFPPVRRPQPPIQRMQHRQPSVPSPQARGQLDEVFKKLHSISK